MSHRIFDHLRGNVVAYVALFVALGGSSYAAVRLTPGSVTSRALAKGAVTHAKLATNSVNSANIADRSLTSSDFQAGAIIQGLKGDAGTTGTNGPTGADGAPGIAGLAGPKGDAGAQGPAGKDGNAAIVAKARMSGGAVSGAHGASTSIPVSGGTWTQAAGDLNLITGTATMKIPAACTGSFGNSLVLSVDGAPQSFAVAPSAPASSTVTMPFIIGTVSEPDKATSHTLTASFSNSCTQSGEDYSVSSVKADVLKFGA
jgi:hypothetical protein